MPRGVQLGVLLLLLLVALRCVQPQSHRSVTTPLSSIAWRLRIRSSIDINWWLVPMSCYLPVRIKSAEQHDLVFLEQTMRARMAAYDVGSAATDPRLSGLLRAKFVASPFRLRRNGGIVSYRGLEI